MLIWDLKVQLRHHIFTANVLSTAFICGFVMLLPISKESVELASFFIFADPALIGLSFVGAIVLMEKAMRVHLALGVTPSPHWVYVLSKTIILTIAGTLSGLAVAVAAYGLSMNWFAMAGALILSNAVAVLLGFIFVAKSRSMNELLLQLLYVSAVLFLPLLAHFDIVPDIVDYALMPIPSTQMLWLLDLAGNAKAHPAWKGWVAVAYLLAWIGFGFQWALKSYRLVLSEGR